MKKVEVLTGPQGGGKTSVMCREAADKGGLYLFAAPTIELIGELEETLGAYKGLEVRAAHSKSKGKGTTVERLAFAREDITRRGFTKAVILTTHETLMASDLSAYQGWHARIDEAPAAVQAGKIDVRLLRSWFKATFALTAPPESEWASLSLIGNAADWKAVEKSPVAGLSEFQKQARVPERVFVKAPSWDVADEVEWFSMWTPLELNEFESVQIAGTSYMDSIGYRSAKSLLADLLDFGEREIGDKRTKQPRIAIHYFTRAHTGSTTFWATSDGRLQIKKVCDHLAKLLKKKRSYWSGNTVVQHLMEHRIKGLLIEPTACGLNKHAHRDACAFIFSAKAREHDAALESAFGITKEQIRKAREDDAIAQFAMRGVIRNATYEGPYDIYLYEEGQANRLRHHLVNRAGFTEVSVQEIEEAGILDEKRRARGRNVPQQSPAEIAAKKKERNDKAAKRMRDLRAHRKAEGQGL